MNVLDRILTRKREEVEVRRRAAPLEVLRDRPLFRAATRPFLGALRARDFAVIAELKKASPSKGIIREDFDVPSLAAGYARGGAAALSVLTDEPFFQGHLDYLPAAKAAVRLPILRKDFLVDAYQLHEARAYGADAVLLIVAALEQGIFRELYAQAGEMGLDVLVEVHNEEEIEAAIGTGARCVGINPRPLRSFPVDLATAERLVKLLPPAVTAVSESGIAGGADVQRLVRAGIRAALIGESFMREADPGAALASLLREAGVSAGTAGPVERPV